MESLVLPNSWTLNMKDGSTPIVVGLQQQIDNWRLVIYLQRTIRKQQLHLQQCYLKPNKEQLTFYRKALKDLSTTLAETVFVEKARGRNKET